MIADNTRIELECAKNGHLYVILGQEKHWKLLRCLKCKKLKAEVEGFR